MELEEPGKKKKKKKKRERGEREEKERRKRGERETQEGEAGKSSQLHIHIERDGVTKGERKKQKEGETRLACELGLTHLLQQ